MIGFSVFILLAGMVSIDDEARERAEIARVIDDSIGWFKTKDFDRLDEIFPEDPDLFLFQPTSKGTVVGGEAFRESTKLWRDPQNVYLSHSITDLRIKLSESGTVAWWSARLDDCGSYGGQEFCWKDCRWTGVLEKRQGKWVIVQGHFSFAKDKVIEELNNAKKESSTEEFTDYAQMRKRAGELFSQQNFAAASVILKKGFEQFPDHLMANTFNLAQSALFQNEHEKAIYWLEEGHRRNIFYSKPLFETEVWLPLAEHPRYLAFLKHNDALIAEAQSKAVMKLDLVKPAGYSPEKRYPVFIALHGGGENIAEFKPHWTSPRLQNEFIVAYVQSSQVLSTTGFHWQDDKITKRDLALAWQQIQEESSVDPNAVYIGGFSSGGYGSLQALFSGVIPARGFIILCPELPALPSDIEIDLLIKNKVKGTLVTTEMDARLERQKEFATFMTGVKVPVQLVITPDIGHWYPENLPQLIDQALGQN